MRSRFFLTEALALIAGFLIIVTQAFGSGAAEWIGFGCGVAALAVCASLLVDSARRHRGPSWLALASVGLVIAGWNIVASLVFSAPAAIWLMFGNGCGLLALALAGLTLHEVSTERVVHSLEVGDSAREQVGA